MPAVVPVVAGKTPVNLQGSATDTEGGKAFVFGIKTQSGISVCALLLQTNLLLLQKEVELRAQHSGRA